MHISPDIFFSALAHITRLRCLSLLLEHDQLCVCELTHAIGAAQPNISRHLAQLREAELVIDHREGLWIHYRINPALPEWVTSVLEQTARGVRDAIPFTEDRSALAAMPNRHGRGKFRGFSAGSHPRGGVHPLALYELELNNYSTAGLRSKDWNEFASSEAPRMDFVFNVCDNAAAEVCPVWPGQPMTAHWGVEDPVAIEGEDFIRKTAFATAFRELQSSISIFANLPLESLDKLRLQEKLDEIGHTRLANAEEPAARR